MSKSVFTFEVIVQQGGRQSSVGEVHKFLLREEEFSSGYYFIYIHRTRKVMSHGNPVIEIILHGH